MVGIHGAMNIQITKQIGVELSGWSYIILTRGMGKTNVWTLIVVSSWWEACLTVGIPVLKILSLDIQVCTVTTFSWYVY